ncbi:MAG: 1,4-dihydroxy-2-naphthoate octaprenyltransferase [Rubrivivax sp.]|nr:1,4-dihydroxy-2-naphthoate octaprenyltransferase [Rubrivivax sp.]
MAAAEPGDEGTAQPPGRWHVAWLAIRPKTLSLSVTPVAVGTALAVAEGHPLLTVPLTLAVLCALLIQVATNLHNDAMDGVRGTDGPDRLGPARVTASGWASARAVLWAARLCATAALLFGAALVWIGGWVVMGIGLASLAAGWWYSGGPRPVSHGPLGEAFVLVFFGGVAVAGSHWLQAGHTTAAAWLAGAIVGLPAAAVLLLNNLRDLDSDTRAGRRTLVWHLGLRRTRQLHAWLLMGPCALVVCLALFSQPGVALACLSLPLAWQRVRALRSREPGAWLNGELGATARLGLIQGVLLCAGLLACPHP